MTRFATILLVVFCVVSIRADDKPPEAPKRHRGDGRTYEKKITASIVLPKDWVQGKSEGGSYLVFRGPAGQGRATVNVRTFNAQGVPITTLGPGMKQVIVKGLEEWKIVDEGYGPLDGKRAYYLAGQFMNDFGDRKIKMQMMTYFVISPKRGYTITFWCEAEKYEGLKTTIEEAAKSFRGD